MAFVALHLGAGNHSIAKRESYMTICKDACEKAMPFLNLGRSALECVVHAIVSLEDEELTNAGYGSNLNVEGYVECDASLMDGNNLLFGSVGALQSIQNPIEVAKLIIDNQKEKMPLGLVPSNFLAGQGAKTWALSKGFEIFKLESDKSRQAYNKYKRRLEHHEREARGDHKDHCYFQDVKHRRMDTVGAICVDLEGNVASGVSSGGLILKQEGRIGQAAIIGAGCWAEGNIATTTSGIGEYIIRTSLAKQCAQELAKTMDNDANCVDALNNVFNQNFFGSPLMHNISRDDHLAGVLGLVQYKNPKSLELLWAHSTASMCVGYMESSAYRAKAFVSELPSNTTPGSTVTVQSRLFSNL